jgi:hypothetical protein
MSSRLIRVLAPKTRATPNDALAYFEAPDRNAEDDEVHIAVTFIDEKSWAEHLAEKWKRVAPVKVGGVAYGDPGAEYLPGRYIKPGYAFTSRGCPRRCWFCSMWKCGSVPRLLPIIDGWNVIDDILLACPRHHVEAKFAMLKRQGRRIEFTGGLEALSLHDYQVDLLASLKPRPTIFFAYDPGDAFETLEHAARQPIAAGVRTAGHNMRAYVLIGYPEDTFAAAEQLLQAMSSGNSRAAFLRRLRKDRPDIHARVIAGELMPHAGMIDAGFRKARPAKPATTTISLEVAGLTARALIQNGDGTASGVASAVVDEIIAAGRRQS